MDQPVWGIYGKSFRIWLGTLQQLQDICRIEILSHILGLTTMGTQLQSITVVQMTSKKMGFPSLSN